MIVRRRLVLGVASALVVGCGTSAVRQTGAPAATMRSGAVQARAAQHPAVSRALHCVANALAQRGITPKTTVAVFGFNAAATAAPYAPGLPPADFGAIVTATLHELGFSPFDLGDEFRGLAGVQVLDAIRPDYVLRGTIAGVEQLIERVRDATDGGVGPGGGRGAAVISGSNETLVAVGRVTATANIRTRRLIDAPTLNKERQTAMYQVTAAATSSIEFLMDQRSRQVSVGVVIGGGLGNAREFTTVWDIQAASMDAARLVTALAIAKQFQLTSTC